MRMTPFVTRCLLLGAILVILAVLMLRRDRSPETAGVATPDITPERNSLAPEVGGATPSESRNLVERLDLDAPAGATTSERKENPREPVTESEFRLANLERWLDEVESGKADISASSTRLLLCASIAGILDSQGRGIDRKQREHTQMPNPDSGQWTFVYNGTLYIFPGWEFPEYGQFLALSRKQSSRVHPIAVDESAPLLEEIVRRGHQALLAMK